MITRSLKKMLSNIKKIFIYSAEGKQFNLNSIKNFLTAANNQKATEKTVINYLKNNFSKEMQDIVDANPRKQKKEKDILLGVYKDIVNLLGPLLELSNVQINPETQESEELTSMHTLFADDAWIKLSKMCRIIKKTAISKGTKNINTKSNAQ